MKKTSVANQIILYLVVSFGAVLTVFPLYWMFALATHTTGDIYSFPPPIGIGEHLIDNIAGLLEGIPYLRHMLNSIVVAGGHVALVLLFCSMGGYAFAMYRFPGRNWLFGLCLSTLMIPWMANIVPWFIIIREIGWIDNLLALVVPNAANAFGIFWMRQYIQSSVPRDLPDQARVDGCPEFFIFFRVVAPTLTPAFSALGIFMFVLSWNNFLVPLVVLRSEHLYTLPLSLVQLLGDPVRGYDVGILMTAASLAVLPIIVVFLFFSRRFISGMMAGAIKG